jgi:glutathione S-transferase
MRLGVADVDRQEHLRREVSSNAVAERMKLYAVPASHPCAAVEAALQLKGLAYERVDLLPLVHVVHQQVVFGRRTVPAMKLADGERVVGSQLIMRVLDGLVPQPPLLPADPAQRARVEAAEAFGADVLQPLARRLVWATVQRRPDALSSYAEGADLPIPASLAASSAPLIARLERLLHGASEQRARADLAALPGHLDRIDADIATGALNGDTPSAADLQIASSLRLLTTLGDVRPLIDGRPAGELARRLFERYPGSTPAGTLPGDWLPATA